MFIYVGRQVPFGDCCTSVTSIPLLCSTANLCMSADSRFITGWQMLMCRMKVLNWALETAVGGLQHQDRADSSMTPLRTCVCPNGCGLRWVNVSTNQLKVESLAMLRHAQNKEQGRQPNGAGMVGPSAPIGCSHHRNSSEEEPTCSPKLDLLRT